MPTNDFTTELAPHLQYNHVVKAKASSDDVISHIVEVINEQAHTPFVKMVADKLSYGNPDAETFIKRLFDYSCHSVSYLRDPQGREIIFTPKLLISRGKGDCKKFSTFIASVLEAKGIEPILKVVSYGGQDWEHIYVIVPTSGGYITTDPVNDEQYDKEVGHSHYRLFYLNGTKSKIMSNQLESMGHNAETKSMHANLIPQFSLSASNLLSDTEKLGNAGMQMFGIGIGCPGLSDAEIHAMNLSGGIGKKGGGFFKKLVAVAKKAAFVTQRATFLGLIMLGKALEHSPLKLHLASHLVKSWNKDGGKHLSALWTKFGGNPKILQKTILKGMKTGAPSAVHGIGYVSHEIDLNDHRPLIEKKDAGISGVGFVTMAAVGGAITAALPILTPMLKHLKDAHIITPEVANSAERTLDSAADQYKDDGTHTTPLANNDIAQAGAKEIGDHAEAAVASQTGGEAQAASQLRTPPPSQLPGGASTHGSVINFYQPLAFNTWFKAAFLSTAYTSMTHEPIGMAAMGVSYVGMIVSIGYKFLIKNK